MVAESISNALLGVGTTLTLTVIVMIALAIGGLALFYVSAAVVVLERFARAVRGPLWPSVFGLGIALAMGYLLLRAGEEVAGSAGGGAPGPSVLVAFGGALALTAAAIAVSWLALRRLSSSSLARVVLIALGLGAGLAVGGASRLALALAAPAAVGAVALGLWLRRRVRRGRIGAPGPAEGQLRWLFAALAVGPVLAIALPEANGSVSAAGVGLLQLVWVLIVVGLVPLAAAGLVEMRRSAEWFLAVRYLIARRRQVYISAITLLCIAGIAAGVWLIVTVLAVMNGFERAWREQIVGDMAHFTVHSGLGRMSDYRAVLEVVEGVPGVAAAAVYLDAEGMVRDPRGRLFGVRLRGIDPESVAQVTDVASRILDGSFDALRAPDEVGEGRSDAPGIVIGEPLAKKLGVGTGAELILISPFGGPPTPLGPAPRLKRFRVAGVFRSQLQQFGEVYTYVSISDARDVLRAGDVVDGIEARTPDLYTSRQVADAVRQKLGSPYYTRDWKDHFPVFFAALRDNRSMMVLLLGMIMVVAAFMIVATLMMMIMEKSSDIAILKAMGAEDAMIERVFAIEGALIGLAGTCLGVIAGLATTSRIGWIQDAIEAVTGIDTLPAEIYQLSTLPADHDPVQLFGIVAMAMVLALGATLVPARQAAGFDPVEGLRAE